MPTYDYVCESPECLHEWEEVHSIAVGPLKECPKCKLETAKRLISGKGSFVLKGGGWFSEGYGSSK